MPEPTAPLTWELIEEARQRIAGRVNVTPVLTSETLDAQAGARLFFKCETFQKCGAFKARGAANAVFALSEDEARRGVATHSSGNHAAALARAARLRGIRAYIVMPDNTPEAKRASVRRYGGEISYCAATLAARESAARELVERTGAAFVHPYDNLMFLWGRVPEATAVEQLVRRARDQSILLARGALFSPEAAASQCLRFNVCHSTRPPLIEFLRTALRAA